MLAPLPTLELRFPSHQIAVEHVIDEYQIAAPIFVIMK
jgi:hypothetical protein